MLCFVLGPTWVTPLFDLGSTRHSFSPQTPRPRAPYLQCADAQVFHSGTPESALNLIGRTLTYEPNNRLTAIGCCADPFFDDLRNPNTRLPNGNPLPPLFNFSPEGMFALRAGLFGTVASALTARETVRNGDFACQKPALPLKLSLLLLTDRVFLLVVCFILAADALPIPSCCLFSPQKCPGRRTPSDSA